MQAEGKIPTEKGKMLSAAVKHDDWCQVYKCGECNCDPEIEFTAASNENRESVSRRIDEEGAKFRDKVRKKMI